MSTKTARHVGRTGKLGLCIYETSDADLLVRSGTRLQKKVFPKPICQTLTFTLCTRLYGIGLQPKDTVRLTKCNSAKSRAAMYFQSLPLGIVAFQSPYDQFRTGTIMSFYS